MIPNKTGIEAQLAEIERRAPGFIDAVKAYYCVQTPAVAPVVEEVQSLRQQLAVLTQERDAAQDQCARAERELNDTLNRLSAFSVAVREIEQSIRDTVRQQQRRPSGWTPNGEILEIADRLHALPSIPDTSEVERAVEQINQIRNAELHMWVTQVEELRRQLASIPDTRAWARHHADCMIDLWETMAVMTRPRPACTCGLDTVLQEKQK